MEKPLGWNYPAGAEHDPRAPWNEPAEPDYERLDRVFANIVRRLEKMSGHKISIDLDGGVDEPCTVSISFDVPWESCLEDTEEVLKDLASALEVRRHEVARKAVLG